MSGPIVRRYGFPNFEKIFGTEAPQHGVQGEPAPPAAASPEVPASPDPDPAEEERQRATATEVSAPTEFGGAVE